MNLNFDIDWKKLLGLPFGRGEKIGAIFKSVYDLLLGGKLKRENDRLRLYKIKQRMLMPVSRWSIDYAGIAQHIAERHAAGKPIDIRTADLIDGLKNLPTPEAQEMIAEEERRAEKGEYAHFFGNPEKYDVAQFDLRNNMELQHRWHRFKKKYKVDKFRDAEGVVRRTMMVERNERPESWYFNPDDERSRFQTAFDALAEDFDLYGYLGDTPLLLKPSVTIGPFGTVIVLPKYMSFDWRRDFIATELSRVHNVHDHKRQGPKWTPGRQKRNMKCAAVYFYNERALKAGLEGEDRRLYVIEHAQLEKHVDLRNIRKMANEGEKLFDL